MARDDTDTAIAALWARGPDAMSKSNDSVEARLHRLEGRMSRLEEKPRVKRLPIQMWRIEKYVSNVTGKRRIGGLATTPSVDMMGDIVEPRGGKWKLPLPLLWQHHHDQPIGWVRDAVVSDEGVRIVAELAEGLAKADEVWGMLEAGLVNSFSIGFLGVKGIPLPSGGTRWTDWTLIEVSVVTIPANPDAKVGKRAGEGSIKLLPSGAVRLIGRPSAQKNAGSVRLIK